MRSYRAAREKADRGFTLVELLVVIAIIILLLSLIMPTFRGALARAKEIQCTNNLRQIGVLCILYARDHKSELPRGNVVNPATFAKKDPVDGRIVAEELDKYLRNLGMAPVIWYCPSLDDPAATPNKWMKFNEPDPYITANNEFRIGYMYLGGIKTSEDQWKKFKKYFDGTRLNDPKQELAFDYCAAWEVAPQSAQDVPAGAWHDYPHPGRDNPGNQNLVLMDGHVERRTRASMTLGFVAIHPRRMYW